MLHLMEIILCPFSFYLCENKLHLHYKDLLVNDVQENNHSFWELHKPHKHIVSKIQKL
jgi:hypothetical protein